MGLWVKIELKQFRIGVEIPNSYSKKFHIFTYHDYGYNTNCRFIQRNYNCATKLYLPDIISGELKPDHYNNKVRTEYKNEFQYLDLYRKALEHFNKYLALI